MSPIKPCPDCNETPKPERTGHDWVIACECHDPTPMNSWESLTPPQFYGHGYDKETAICNWNCLLEEWEEENKDLKQP